jgi:serine protease Do
LRWLPDWLIYSVAICAILLVMFRLDQRAETPAWSPDEFPGAGEFLPPPSVFDPEILVDVEEAAPGLGTAFVINPDGYWLTARHVVDGCEKVAVLVSRGRALPAEVRTSQFADLAFLETEPVPGAIALHLAEEEFMRGQPAYHVGFPQGRPGEAASRLVGRERLVARGRYSSEEPVLAWAETGRTWGVDGSLAGMSGGPTLDAQGRVIGVTIAESPRRGRIYTASPASIAQWLDVARVEAAGEPTAPMNDRNYFRRADELRRDMVVRPVVCQTPVAEERRPLLRLP